MTQSSPSTAIYSADFALWIEHQADLLRARGFEQINVSSCGFLSLKTEQPPS